jgi:hypothetical protein
MVKPCCYGVGFDSGKYGHRKTFNRIKLKPYSVWRDMIKRCYHQPYKDKNPSYQEVTCCESWKDYQEFAEWFVYNYQQGYELDKDVLVDGNQVYSPETCAFIPRALNLFKVHTRGKSNVGVCKSHCGFTAYCNNGFGKTVNLGSSDSEQGATLLYKEYKESLAKKLADDYFSRGAIDIRVRDALYSFTIN